MHTSKGKVWTIFDIQKALDRNGYEMHRTSVLRNLEFMIENGYIYSKDEGEDEKEIYREDRNFKEEPDADDDSDKRNTRKKNYIINLNHKPTYEISLNLDNIQLLILSLLNLGFTSTNFFKDLSQETRDKLFKVLNSRHKKEIKNTEQIFKQYKGVYKKPHSFPKNKLEPLMKALREKKWVSANLKDYKLSDKKRNTPRKLAIGSISFKNNIPYVIAFDEDDSEYKSIRATRLNHLKILKENINQDILDEIDKYETEYKRIKIKICCNGQLAQILKESRIDDSHEVVVRDNFIEASFNIRVTNSLINLISPHLRDIISVKPKKFRDELIIRTKENYKKIKNLS